MNQPKLCIEQLDLLTATQEADVLLPLMGLVNESAAAPSYLLTSHKGDGEPLYGKWEHSRILREDGKPIGLALVYERPADESPLYPEAELHLGILAVDNSKQGKGYGSLLLRQFVDEAIIRRDFTFLGGPIKHVGLSVADNKVGPRKLYGAFGFSDVGLQERETETLHVMRAGLLDVVKSEKYQQTPVL